MSVFLFGVLVVVVLFLIYDIRRKNDGVPGPFAWPLIGSLPSLLPHVNDIIPFHAKYFKNHHTYKIWSFGIISPEEAIITKDPENVKYFLSTNFSNYRRKSNLWRFDKLFGQGIFNSNGEQWKFHRRTARPLFNKQSIAQMLPHFIENGRKVLQILDKAAETGSEIDVQEIFFGFTLDSIASIGFGHSLNSLDRPVAFSEAFNNAQECVVLNARNPLLRYLPDKKFDIDYNTMEQFIHNIIAERMSKDDYHNRKDLLSMYMSMAKKNGESFTEEYLKDMILNFFIAGRDTTACLLTWTFYLLSQNSDVEAKLVQVIDNEIGNSEPTNELLNSKELTYLQNVLDETLRIYPPVPFDVRRAAKEDQLPDGTIVHANAGIVYSSYFMGRDERYWKDALKFKPERFEEPYNTSSFVSFHAGPQTCLGRAMAYLEAKTMVTLILQKYTLRLVPGHNVEPRISIVMSVKEGLKVTVGRRHVE